jgi:nitrate/nitrite-specific signal transduction histidine kinase
MDVPGKSSGLLKSDAKDFSLPAVPQPARLKIIRSQIVHLLVQHRLLFVLVVAAVVVLVKVVDVYFMRQSTWDLHIWFDGLIYSALISFLAWGLLSLLHSTVDEKKRGDKNSSLLAAFSRKLGDTRSWDEIIQQIVAYTHQVADRADFTLYVVDPNSLHLEAKAACTKDGKIALKPEQCAEPQPGAFSRYNLPVSRNDLLVGMIQLEYPAGVTPSPAEIQSLTSAAPVMGLALEGALLQSLAADQAAESENQRLKIAQHLHDSLAQNISYLRLKLDQLTGEHAVQEMDVVRKELERMRITADEAYDQVRNTLEELKLVRTEDLTNIVIEQAQTISTRSNFTLNTSQMGTPFPLAAFTCQQIIYIAREALHNIEKHAQACQVHLQFIWLENELIIKIADDGIGFDPFTKSGEEHYGVWIMQHRANDINGKLKITPAEKHGTEITLWIPREHAVEKYD